MFTKYFRSGSVPTKFAPIGQYYKNICYLHKTRFKVATECCDRFVQEKEQYDVTFVYNGNRETYTVAKGMPV